MSLTIYNTQTRQKEAFTPTVPGEVKMYCCGVTVYDDCHLGHARSYIVWDTVRRYLLWRGYKVRYVQNFTDIDDKILNRAKERGSTMSEVSEQYIDAYFRDLRQLNVKDADAYPRVTEHIEEICDLIQTLIDKTIAYPANGDVYYSVQAFPSYGKLSGRTQDQMQSGASGRVSAEDSKKRHPFDFALWKGAKPGEPAWDSPWGKGRPGWHIECSAMIRSSFGDTIDIHGGGGDLVFPHHENEIAQSEGATGKPLAKYWTHNGMVRVNGEKMSKSLGNFTTIREMLDRIDPMVVRLFVLQAQYRKPLDFTDDAIASAENGWTTLKDGLLFGNQFGEKLGWSDDSDLNSQQLTPLEDAIEKFQTAMDDDFNTPGGLAVVFELAKELRRVGNILVHGGDLDVAVEHLQRQWQTLVELAAILGLEAEPETTEPVGGMSDEEILDLIAQRQAARKAKNFAEADRIRDELNAQRISLIDKPGETTFVRS
ncbi:MAG: cysteine--tRNA ligase [Cyanobacteria bacterium SID2]|nr:cysteine--tRNA ligase [Cyanobacteria bacterium SID2]MBP0003061.1 cysteine--tRNA ligase [Cyanobacteria bacterium SBC]